MREKNKIVGIMMLAIMLLCGLAATADAAPVVVDGGVVVTIANSAATSQQLAGDITVNGTSTDMVVGSTIAIICPAGLKFDSIHIGAMATLTTSAGFTVSAYNQTGAYVSGFSNDGRTMRVKVDAIPGTGSSSIMFAGNVATGLAVLPSANRNPSIDTTGLTFQVVTNGNTSSAVTNTVGVVNILKVPIIQSATATDSQHFTLQFNCSINSETAKSTALASGLDLTTDELNGLQLSGFNATPLIGTVAIDGSDATKVNVTLTSGSIFTDASSKVKTGSSGKQFANAKDVAAVPTITSITAGNYAGNTFHDFRNILPVGSVINSVTLSKTSIGASTSFVPFVAGVPVVTAGITDDAFIATISTTAGVGYQARLAYYSATTLQTLTTNTDGWQADYNSGGAAKLVDDIGTSGVHTINGASNGGSIGLYFQIGDNITASNAGLGPTKEGNLVVQASLDNFNTLVQSSPITVDRIIPTVVNITGNKPVATSTSTITAMFSEAVKKTTAENTNSWRVNTLGTGTAVNVTGASLASDGKTVTVTTTVMTPSKSYALEVSPGAGTQVTDLVGNPVADSLNAFAVTAPGGPITGITITQPSTTPPRVASGSTLTVQVNAASGATVLVHLVNSTAASTATTGFWDGCSTYPGGCQLSEATSGVYKGNITVNTTSSGIGKVIASTDGFASRFVSTDTITVDTTGPAITSTVGIGCKNALVNFNETLTTSTIDASTTAFSVSPSLGTVTSQTRPGKNAVLLTFTNSASAGITYTITASASLVKDEVGNLIASPNNIGTFTGLVCDNAAPTIASTSVATGDTKVTVLVTDDSGSAAVDMLSTVGTSKTKITSVVKNGVTQSGTITNDTTNVACIFTPDSPFTAGTYNVNLDVADLAGNTGLRSTSFTVCGSPTCSANPSPITIQGGTSSISVVNSGGCSLTYTAAITADTTGGATISGSGPWTLTPGATAGSVTVTVTDSQNPPRTCTSIVAYTPCVLTVAATKSAANGEKISVGATGGVLPYVYMLMTATATGAAIDPVSGDYLAPSVSSSTDEIETIMAIDANGCSGTTTVKISSNAVEVTTTGSGTATVTISGGTGATYAVDDGVGAVTSGGVFTSSSDGVGVVKVTKGTEWAKVVITVEGGICTVESPIAVQDVNMDGATNVNDLTPVIDAILAP